MEEKMKPNFEEENGKEKEQKELHRAVMLFSDGTYSDLYSRAGEGGEIKGKTKEEVEKILGGNDEVLYKKRDTEEETFTPFSMHMSDKQIGIFSEINKDIAFLKKEE